MTRTVLGGRAIYHFDRENEPAWRVSQGEKLTVRCPDGMHGTIQSEADLYHAVDPDRVNDAVGPIYVEGAEPGDTLVVEIEDIRVPAEQGYILLIPGFGLLQDRVGEPVTKICHIADGHVQFEGLRLPLDPCVGTIGVAPAQGRISTVYPGDHGGNMDTTDVRKGVKLYLPVAAPGALLAMGDGKAIMGDGEVCGTGVGVPLDIDITCTVLKGVGIERPMIETATSWMTIGSAPTLEESCKLATLDMIAVLMRTKGWDFQRAYMFTSLVGHLRISQVVDPWMTVRMEVAKEFGGEDLLASAG